MKPRWVSRPILAAAVGAALFACVDGESPLEQDLRLRTRFAVLPDYSAVSAFGQTAEISRIRLTARDAATGTVVPPTPSTFDVDPTLEEWDLPLELEVGDLANGQVVILMELISVVGGVETVEFSGETAPLSVTAGSTQQVAQAEVHPGNPENLAATSVTIGGAPDALVEGDDAPLSASVGGVSAPDVFWTALDPGIAQVQKTGATSAEVLGVLPGTARIVAAAGTRRDTVSVQILQRPTSVELSPSATELASLNEETEFEAEVLDPRGTPVTGAQVTWDVEGPAILENLGNGRFRALANGATEVRATVVDFPEASGTAEVSVAQVAAAVSVTPADATLDALGETLELQAHVQDALGNEIEGVAIVWTSSAVAIVSVSGEGVATAEAEGTAEIRATVGAAVGEADVTVHQVVAAVEVEPGTHTFESIGDSHTFSAVAFDANDHEIAGRAVVWTSTDEDVVLVDDDGTATAAGNGSASVIATVEGESGATSVDVEQRAVDIEISPASHTFTALEDEHGFSAEARDARGNVITGRAPEWSSSADGVVSVDDEGLATAVGNGTAEITAEMDGVSATADVTVAQVAASVAVTPEAHTLESIGETVELTAAALDANGNPVASAVFEWTSDAPAVATVDADGVVTAEGNGTAEITATSGSESASATITVQQAVADLELSPESHTFSAVGEMLKLAVLAFDARGEPIPVEDLEFDWSSEDDDVVSVDDHGVITAEGRGVATISVESDGAEASGEYTVVQQVASVVIDPAEVTVDKLTETLQFSATAFDANDNVVEDVDFTWSSGDTDIVTVDQNGTATTVGNGTTTIHATVEDDDVAGAATVIVRQVAVSMEIDKTSINFAALGQSQRLVATLRDPKGQPIEDAVIGWHSLNPAVATVDQTGLVTAVAEGTAVIEAREQGLKARTDVTVSQKAASVEVTPAEHLFANVGDTVSMAATVRDSTGHLITDETVEWGSSNGDVAMVTSTGFVTAIGPGNATIHATVHGVRGEAAVEVQEDTSDGIVDRVLVISGGHTDDMSTFVAAVQPQMPDVTIETMFTNSQTPTLAYLQTFDVVLVYENGNFSNVTSVGNAIANYVEEGGNVVLGTFVWQDWSGVPNNGGSGWGFLENLDPFNSIGGSEYSPDRLDTSTLMTHPLTNGIDSLWVNSYRGGVVAKEGTTVLARWADGSPLIGYRIEEGGQRIVAISTFPGYYYYGGFSGDFTQMWINALNWAGGANADTTTETTNTSSLRFDNLLMRKSEPAPYQAAPPATGGTSGNLRGS